MVGAEAIIGLRGDDFSAGEDFCGKAAAEGHVEGDASPAESNSACGGADAIEVEGDGSCVDADRASVDANGASAEVDGACVDGDGTCVEADGTCAGSDGTFARPRRAPVSSDPEIG